MKSFTIKYINISKEFRASANNNFPNLSTLLFRWFVQCGYENFPDNSIQKNYA